MRTQRVLHLKKEVSIRQMAKTAIITMAVQCLRSEARNKRHLFDKPTYQQLGVTRSGFKNEVICEALCVFIPYLGCERHNLSVDCMRSLRG